MFLDDEREIGNSIIVTLNYGYEFGDDTFQAVHVKGFDHPLEAREGIKDAVTCQCDECSNNPHGIYL